MAAPRVAIVIVNYNGGHLLDELAASLAQLTYANHRLYLVDNASPDGSGARLAALFPNAAVVLNTENRGLAPAINQALGRCLTEDTAYVLLLNPDTTHAPDFLDRLVEVADASTLVVPKVLWPDGGFASHAGGFDWTRGLLLDTHDGEVDTPAISTQREVDVASFNCMLIPAAAFRAVGPLDERLAMYYEDTDFCARARKAGFRILYQPAAVIHHAEGGSSGGTESPFKHYYATRNRAYVVRKHAGRLRYIAFTAYFLATRLSKIVDYARKRDWPLLRSQLFATRDFYLGRMGMTYQPEELVPDLYWQQARGDRQQA
jgi:GT2 family glycosyltransferase